MPRCSAALTLFQLQASSPSTIRWRSWALRTAAGEARTLVPGGDTVTSGPIAAAGGATLAPRDGAADAGDAGDADATVDATAPTDVEAPGDGALPDGAGADGAAEAAVVGPDV